MSHFTTIATQIVSAKHLVLALKDLGFPQIEVHAEPQLLVGWGGARSLKAHVIIRKNHLGDAWADLGFARNAKGTFDALIEDMDRRRFGSRWLQKLTQRYAYHASRDLLSQQNFSLVQEQQEKDGTIRLTVRRMA